MSEVEVAAAAESVVLGVDVEVVEDEAEVEDEEEVVDDEVEEDDVDDVVDEEDVDVPVVLLLDSLLVVVAVSEIDILTVASCAVTPLAVFATVAAWSLAVPHPHCENPPSKLFL